MPAVKLFGLDLNEAFRRAVRGVGSYSEIYNRNLAPILPRSGRNLLVDHENPGPQLYIPPGIINP